MFFYRFLACSEPATGNPGTPQSCSPSPPPSLQGEKSREVTGGKKRREDLFSVTYVYGWRRRGDTEVPSNMNSDLPAVTQHHPWLGRWGRELGRLLGRERRSKPRH